MTELEKKIKYYADEYYKGNEVISDDQYDALLKQLRKENPESEFLKGEVLGDNLKGVSKKYNLPVTMGSLGKCNTEEEMEDWWEKHPHDNLVAETKIDGNSQLLEYKNGEFVFSYSRGNAVTGEDTTAKMACVTGVIHKLRTNFTGHIRGEVAMRRSTFNSHFKDSGYKNPRNLTAGLMGRNENTDLDKLEFIAYDVFDDDNNVDTTEIKKLNFLEANGFTIPEFKINPTFAELLDWKNTIHNEMEIPCDGIVIKQNKVDKQDLMKLVPTGNIAFKPNLQTGITTIKDIRWQMRGSLLSPVVDIEPTELEGTTVVKASVANINKMKKLGLYIGAKVMVSKHGMIIPQIDAVVEPKENAFEIPSVCPACGQPLTLRDTGTFPECKNPECPRKMGHKYARLFGTLDIRGAGNAFVAALEESGTSYKEFFEMLTKGPKDVFNEFAGGVNGEKVYVQLNKAIKEPITPAKFLSLFDYLGLSEGQFTKLGSEKELKDILKMSETDMANTKGVGPETAAKFSDFFNKNLEEILEISRYFNVKAEKIDPADASKPTVCFTGACPGYTRSQLADKAKDKYTVVGAVNKDLQILVCADPNSGSGKLKAAAKNGTKVISYDEFLATLN